MRELTFSKSDRLLKPEEFTKVFKEGRRVHTPRYTVCVLFNRLGRNRLGISVSAKVAGAVKRNRVKRVIREFFRLNKKTLFAGSTADIVITVKKIDDGLCYAQAQGDLAAAFAKSGNRTPSPDKNKP